MKASKKHNASPSHRVQKKNYYPLISGVLMVAMLAFIVFLLLREPGNTPGSASTNTGVGGNFQGDKATVEFYVMSQCPYGTQVENAFAPVMAAMGEAIDYKVDYIVSEPQPGVFQALHGEKEVKGNVVQLCAMKHYPDKWVDFISCQNEDARNVDTNYASCAQRLGMDSNKLKSCLESDEGEGLLRESMKRTQAKGATASPTIYINGVPYSGARDTASFQRAVCNYVDHQACNEIPACASDADCTAEAGKEGICNNANTKEASCTYKDPVQFEVIVLNDDQCSSCDTTQILSVTQQLFLGSKPRTVDIKTAEGKQLVQQYGIEVVPAYIFDSKVTQARSWIAQPDLKTAFEEVGGKWKLLDQVTGATYFVSEEARVAFYDSIDVVKGDNKPQIDFFVMSYCPYGNQAEENIKPVYDLLKDKAEFNPRYVIYSNYGGGGSDYCIANGELCSMHGIQELNQNVRELCVDKYMGIDKWFEFALEMNKQCTSQNADTCWENVAKGLGLDVAKIKTCEATEKEALTREQKELGDKLKVSGSPSVFIDGDSFSGARNPESYKTSLCSAFDTAPGECSTKLAGEVATASSAPSMAGCAI